MKAAVRAVAALAHLPLLCCLPCPGRGRGQPPKPASASPEKPSPPRLRLLCLRPGPLEPCCGVASSMTAPLRSSARQSPRWCSLQPFVAKRPRQVGTDGPAEVKACHAPRRPQDGEHFQHLPYWGTPAVQRGGGGLGSGRQPDVGRMVVRGGGTTRSMAPQTSAGAWQAYRHLCKSLGRDDFRGEDKGGGGGGWLCRCKARAGELRIR